jgi:hypothetical protein
MPRTRKRQHPYLASARAYFRVAAKFDRAGDSRSATHYRGVAERRMNDYYRQTEAAERRKQAGTR